MKARLWIAALILIAGVWGSWGTAQHVMLSKGREQGTITVASCADDTCTGPYTPVSAGSKARARVTLQGSVAVKSEPCGARSSSRTSSIWSWVGLPWVAR